MFRKKTVFILGAGASWHYGYPTGEQLIKQVIAKSLVAEQYIKTVRESGALAYRPDYISRNTRGEMPPDGTRGIAAEWVAFLQECQQLRERLVTVDPLVIDYFLGQNPQLRDIGKFLVASVLLECEAHSAARINMNRRDADSDVKYHDNWYRFLVHKLVSGCPDGASLLKNDVTLVTFNYDVSLEYRLYKSLTSIAQFAEADGVIDDFFKPGRVIHIYGQLRADPVSDPLQIDASFSAKVTASADQWQNLKTSLDLIFDSSRQIKTIAPYEKNEDNNVLLARREIASADCIYILGYGFDENNSKLLGLDDALYVPQSKGGRTILFTNYSNSDLINKKASRLLFRRPDQFLSSMHHISRGGDQTVFCEKSVRDVYGALALDFDSPEEQTPG
jgi:hypothetical protein